MSLPNDAKHPHNCSVKYANVEFSTKHLQVTDKWEGADGEIQEAEREMQKHSLFFLFS